MLGPYSKWVILLCPHGSDSQLWAQIKESFQTPHFYLTLKPTNSIKPVQTPLGFSPKLQLVDP